MKLTRPLIWLGIDPGENSGWSIRITEADIAPLDEPALDAVAGMLATQGVVQHSRSNRDRIVGMACEIADEREADIVVAMETWSLHGKWSNVSKLALVGSAGRWLDSLEQYGIGAHRVSRLLVNQWRRELYGAQTRAEIFGKDGASRSEQWKKKAIAHCGARVSVHQTKSKDPNACEATCLIHALYDRWIAGGMGRVEW